MTSNHSKDTPDKDHDRASRTEQVLRETLTGKATTYFADGHTPPAADFPEFDQLEPTAPAWEVDPAHGHKSVWRTKGTYFALAAGVATVALAGSLLAQQVGSHNRSQNVATQPTNQQPTPAGTTGATSDAKAGPSTSIAPLPPHMKRTHNGPVKFLNFPFYCKGVPQYDDDSGFQVANPKTAVNPIEYCTSKGKMHGINPAFATILADEHGGYITSEPPTFSASPSLSKEERLARLRRSALPSGVTYTSTDYEAFFAPRPDLVYKDGKCPNFQEFTRIYRDTIRDITRGTWIVSPKDPQKYPTGGAWCHQRRVDPATRTVYLTEVARSSGKAGPRDKTNLARTAAAQKVLDSVNTKCLTLSRASNIANETARDMNSPFFTRKMVVVDRIVSDIKCARIYRHPSEDMAFVVFGK